MTFRPLALVGAVLALATPTLAAEPPSYVRHVKPFLAKYCLECHNESKPRSDLDLETFKAMMQGGKRGPVVIPGKPDESPLVLTVEGKAKPPMPPPKAKQPPRAEVQLLRDWIAAGARDDTGSVTVALPDIRPRRPVAAPVTALAYHPAGKLLAAGSYKEVVLVDSASGEVTGSLPGQTAAVTALAFSPDGSRLAVASGATGASGEVRIYAAVNDTKPLHVLAAHRDLIHDLAFSPDGKLLATTGYDRLIKLWDTTTGKELRTLKDHSDSVYALAFSPDGKLLASAAADRAVKVWEVAAGTRLYTLGDSTDWVYAVAWSCDGRHVAAAGVDRSIRVWEVTAEAGRLLHSVFAHEGPVLRLAYAADGSTLYSLSEDRVVKAWDPVRMVERKVYAPQPEAPLALGVRPDHKQLALGRYDGALVLLDEATGKVQAQPLPVKPKPPQPEQEPNDSPGTGQAITLPATVTGAIGRPGDVDYFRFPAKAGQQVGVQAVSAGTGSKLDAILQLLDGSGRVLAESASGVLGHTCEADSTYALGIRDREYRGGPEMTYQLVIGPVPVVTAVFPLGLQRGTEAEIQLEGVNLGASRTVRARAPADATVGSRLPLTINTPAGPALGSPSVVVGEFAELVGPDAKLPLPVPGTGNGRIDRPGTTQTWRFTARKGQRLIVEVFARRIGSPLDSFIEILDSKGLPVPRATLRCLAKTYTTFRDHDSASPGIRIEAWNELAVNDYLLVGGELLRIRALPKNPDDDCQFFSVANQRTGFLDTTPTHHPAGVPMYKVAIHPPGTTFPPNGLPVVTLPYRNDDGGPGYGKDSRLFFDPPADGEYQVRIGDARGQGSSSHAYRLTVRPPRPSFTVSFTPTAPAVWKGGAVPLTASVERSDGFDGEIAVQLLDLPPGLSAPATSIPAGENSTAFALWADPTAVLPQKPTPLRLVARASVGGQEIVREVTGGVPKLVEPGDLVTTTEQPEVSLKPGGRVRLTVHIERRNGFTGRVPLDVRGLPHGVRVLDIGLNGILITPQQTTRTIEIYCEPWVQPTDHPFVVLARREGKNTEHAAKSVLLRVTR